MREEFIERVVGESFYYISVIISCNRFRVSNMKLFYECVLEKRVIFIRLIVIVGGCLFLLFM